MLRNHGTHPRRRARPARLALTLASAALVVALAFPAQLPAAPGPSATASGASFDLDLWLHVLWSWLGIPPAPPAGEEGPEAIPLPGGCGADPVGGACEETNTLPEEPLWSPPETETSPETSSSE